MLRAYDEVRLPHPRDARSMPARAAGRPVAASRAHETLAVLGRLVMRLALSLVCVFGFGNFNEKLVGAGDSNFQQVVVLGLWLVAILASLLVPVRRRPAADGDLVLVVAFYGFAALSVLWSGLTVPSVLKSLALLVTTFGAWRLALTLDLDDMMAAVVNGFLAVVVASIGLALLAPRIGVLDTWMHKGQWQGVFYSKQSLSLAAAYLMFAAAVMLPRAKYRLYYALAVIIGAVAVWGSGSRGGGALAVLAIVCHLVSSRVPSFARLLAAAPVLMIAVATAGLLYLLATGLDHFPVAGSKVDLTERTLIWHYALAHFPDGVLIGTGLNGFWTDPGILAGFQREHGWVLDNYHNGYLAILMETGVVGLALFTLCFWRYGARLRRLSRAHAMPRGHLEIVAGFVAMTFFIDFSETFFLRSTNIVFTLLAVMLFTTLASGGETDGRDGA